MKKYENNISTHYLSEMNVEDLPEKSPIVSEKLIDIIEDSANLKKEDPIKEIVSEPLLDKVTKENYDTDPDLDNQYPYRVCFIEFKKCHRREVFFDYPSKKYPFDEQLENEMFECIVLKEDCPNQGQLLTSDEFFEEYSFYLNQRRKEDETRFKFKQENKDLIEDQ